MDVAAAGPAELAAAPPRRGRTVATAVPVVALVLLVALDVGLLLRPRAASEHDRLAAAVLSAARAEAVNLTTISYTTAARDLNRIVAGATGGLRQQFESQQAQFPAVLTRDKSVSKGQVLSSGLVSLAKNGRGAKVDAAVDATVSTTGGGTTVQSVLKHYRMVISLVLVHGRWLASDVAFAGAPQ